MELAIYLKDFMLIFPLLLQKTYYFKNFAFNSIAIIVLAKLFLNEYSSY